MEDNNKTVATRVKELRKTRNLSQTLLARKLNITVTAYNRIENGKTQITVHMLYAIAAALGIAVNDLLDLPANNIANNKSDTMVISANNERVFLSISTEELKKCLSAK